MGFDLPSVPVVDLSQPEEEAADVLKLAALEIGFFYGMRQQMSRAHSSARVWLTYTL